MTNEISGQGVSAVKHVGTTQRPGLRQSEQSFREADALAKLPEAEREAWGKLWVEVAELLKEGSRG